MDAFTLHQRVLADYDAYVRSFLNIADGASDSSSRNNCAGAGCGLDPCSSSTACPKIKMAVANRPD